MNVSRMSDAESACALVSVVVPCFNEEEVVEATYKRLVTVLESLRHIEFELVFVDDGSRDRTLEILRSLQRSDRRIKVVAFSRNFGHQIAVTAGLEHATGDAVVLIDADLQDPPEVIAEMVTRWRSGADVAYGVRTDRAGETPFKIWTAKVFYRALNRLSDVAIPLDTGDFRLMDRAVVDTLVNMPEHDRFVRGMVAWVGFRQEAVTYRRGPRLAGETKYPLKKMLRFAMDGILSFSTFPLRLATWMGLGTASISAVVLLYAMAARLLTDVSVPGWTLLFIAYTSIGGLQLMSLGLLGEYVGRIYREAKRRPLYVVREKLGFSSVETLTRIFENKAQT